MPLPRPLRRFVFLLVTLTAACLVTEFLCARLLHLPYPYDWPLYTPERSFDDLIIYHPRFPAFATPAFFDPPWYPFTYPAPVALLYRAFYTFPDYVTAFLVTAGTLVAAAIALFTRVLRSRSAPWRLVLLLLVPTILCAYPLAFEFQQANLEIFVTVFTTLGLWLFCRGKAWPAAILFGLAASLKLFPIAFLVLFLTRRQYRQAAAAAAIALATILLSLWIACPNLSNALHGMQAGAAFFQHEYALRTTTAFDHSLFALLKAATVLRHPAQALLDPATLTVYLAGAALIAAVVCLRLRRLPLLNQVLALSVLAVLLPPVSFDYTLLNLYAPWALLVLFTLETPEAPGLTPAFVSFAILLAPTSEFILHGIALGAQIKAVALVALLLGALTRPLKPASDTARPSRAPASPRSGRPAFPGSPHGSSRSSA